VRKFSSQTAALHLKTSHSTDDHQTDPPREQEQDDEALDWEFFPSQDGQRGAMVPCFSLEY
jgi:hypothetical protein